MSGSSAQSVLNDVVIHGGHVDCIGVTAYGDGVPITPLQRRRHHCRHADWFHGLFHVGRRPARRAGKREYHHDATSARSLAGKSFVLAPGRQITIVPERIHDRPAILVADGGDSIALIRGDQIRIRRSDNYTLLADTGIRSFYETAFGKLTDRL